MIDFIQTFRDVSGAVTALGVAIGACQLYLNRKVAKAHHERARKDRAILLVMELSNKLGPQWRAASDLAETLPVESLQCIEKGQRFEIDTRQLELLMAAIPDFAASINEELEKASREGTRYQLTTPQVYALRWQITVYLNNIECVAEAARTDVADRKIIARELGGLYQPKKHRTFCQAYRRATNLNPHYKGICALEHYLTADTIPDPDEPIL